MIKYWSLGHFKSVSDKTTLEMSPLTIFTGANSSGKSTIIQSLLLATQTVQNNVHSRSIILNGHIIKLGSFDDILSDNQASNDISIGFELDIERKESKVPRLSMFSRYLFRNIEKPIIKCNFSFSSHNLNLEDDVSNLQPQIKSCKVSVESRENDVINTDMIEIFRTSKDISDRKNQLKINHLPFEEDTSLQYEVKISGKKNIHRRYPINGKVVGIKLLHFLPEKLAIVFNETEEAARETVAAFVDIDLIDYTLESEGIHYNEDFKKHILEVIKSINLEYIQSLKNRNRSKRILEKYETVQKEFTIDNITSYLKELPTPLYKKYSQEIKQNEINLINYLIKGKDPKFTLAHVLLPHTLEFGVSQIREYFSKNVKYLGPLRDEPKQIYPHSGATDSKDVGFKGEHTAAVLEIHKNSNIEYISPKDLAKSYDAPLKTDTLINAVLEWLEYMGVVKKVKTIDRGKLGHELKVTTEDGNSFHDLTNVGVGVSQVLPILVLSLLADRGSMLIFEQPELHLHPRVQTRLADFFVSMIKMRKQCIVETHSEYLINRLRYMSAITENDEVSKEVIMYFVEKHDGKSVYKPIRINKYGVIEEWPKGFFDENEENSASILRASMEKKMRERK